MLKRLYHKGSFCTLFLLTLHVHLFGLSLDFEHTKLTPSSKKRLTQEILKRCPEKLLQELNEKVTIDFNLKESWSPLFTYEPSGHWIRQDQPQPFYQVNSKYRISLHQNFFQACQDPSTHDEAWPFYHQSLYRQALGSTLAALVTLHDRHRPDGPLSKSLAFRLFCGFSPGPLLNEYKNHNTKRSPDPAEGLSPESYLAINMSYFLMDEHYPLRKPATWSYLKKHYGDPLNRNLDQLNTEIYLSNNLVPIDIHPNKVSEIHYLLAAPGKGVISGFGHSLIRLVLSEEGLKGTEALAQPQDHVVFAYQALTLGDLSINHLGGLLGKYPSQLFSYLFTDVQNRYVNVELRELKSFPMVLSQEQKDLFIYRILENYWNYAGRYKFLTRNCATETRDDLYAAQYQGHPIQTDLSMRPQSVLSSMIQHNLIDPFYFSNTKKATELGYYFPIHDRSRELFQQWKKKDPLLYRYSWKGWLEVQPKKRRALYQRLLAKEEHSKSGLALDFFHFENHSRLLAFKELYKSALKLAVKQPKSLKASPRKALRRAESILKEFLPWNLLPQETGYGIPLIDERSLMHGHEKVQSLKQELDQIKGLFVKLLKGKASKELITFEACIENCDFFRQESFTHLMSEKPPSQTPIKSTPSIPWFLGQGQE